MYRHHTIYKKIPQINTFIKNSDLFHIQMIQDVLTQSPSYSKYNSLKIYSFYLTIIQMLFILNMPIKNIL